MAGARSRVCDGDGVDMKREAGDACVREEVQYSASVERGMGERKRREWSRLP